MQESAKTRTFDDELEPVSCLLPEQCRLGCVCSSLAGESRNYGQDKHCQHPECMFHQVIQMDTCPLDFLLVICGAFLDLRTFSDAGGGGEGGGTVGQIKCFCAV